MANKIIKDINEELNLLQNELSRFRTTVDYLDGAKDQVTKAVKTVDRAENHYSKKAEDLKEAYDSISDLETVMNTLTKEL